MKKYVLVGTGHRGTMAYIIPLTKDMQDCVQLCGVYDINLKRARAAVSMAAYPVKVYDDFDKMLNTVKPDKVIVTTIDAKHHEYIIKALEFGCDVVSEKPITTDADKMNAIYAAEQRTGHRVQVTFNMRFMPNYMRIKELLEQGIIGTPYNAHFEWLLDTSHGADYFRRWHRERKNSGSLLIHKSTHHFDMLNWLLDDEPQSVYAIGTRRFYGDTRANRGVRCMDCQYKDACEYYFDVKEDEFYKKIYVDCESEDGYYRDGCIFSENIDIEDTIGLTIKYKKGAIATYSLAAHSPYEGMRLNINGSEGRMEIVILAAQGIFAGAKKVSITVYNRLGEKMEIEPKISATMHKLPRFARCLAGGHGGSDMLLCDMIFRGTDTDPMNLLADSRAGAMSIGIGIAANLSMKENRAVSIEELYDFL